jgi:hypothetical protein
MRGRAIDGTRSQSHDGRRVPKLLVARRLQARELIVA